MDPVRYVLAVMVLIALPPAFLVWMVIHPFARFWRKLGPFWTYGVLAVPGGAVMLGLFGARKTLLAVDFGTSYPLVALGALVFLGAVTLSLQRRRCLTQAIISGLPELSKRRYPGKLVTGGVYAKIRHPRYVEVFLAVLAYALVSNHLAPYVVAVLSVPAIFIIVVLEERELRERFGAEYEEYCRRVPRFVPRFRSRS